MGGDRQKDAEYNVERYARLGIPEYFIYDKARQRLHAYRLCSPDARTYVPMEAERGCYRSEVLGLELEVVEGRRQLWAGNALLLGPLRPRPGSARRRARSSRGLPKGNGGQHRPRRAARWAIQAGG